MEHDLSGDLHLQKEKCTFGAVIYFVGKRKKRSCIFFILTILSKRVTIHGLYLMALWHPQAPLWGMMNHLELSLVLRYLRGPGGRPPSP